MERRVLRIANTMSAAHMNGFSKQFAEELVRRLGNPEVEWVLMPFKDLFESAGSSFELAIQQITITPERRGLVTFSEPYLDVNQGVYVREGSRVAAIERLEDLRGYRLGGVSVNTGWRCITEMVRPTNPPTDFGRVSRAAKAVADGEVDAAVIDATVGIAFTYQFRDTAVAGQV